MDYTLYFADKALCFTDSASSDKASAPCVGPDGPVTRAKVLKFFENNNRLTVLSADPAAEFERFSAEFVPVTAAGGIVVDSRERCLMIRRNDRWDLPKGHREEGETLEECALRETEEETGIRAEELVRPLCDTLHCYNLYGRWEIKHTFWYLMRTGRPAQPVPQLSEGIVDVRWCTPQERDALLPSCYPTVRRVFAALTDFRNGK